MDHRPEKIASEIQAIIQDAIDAQGGFRTMTPELRTVIEETVRQQLRFEPSSDRMMVPIEEILDVIQTVLNLVARTEGSS